MATTTPRGSRQDRDTATRAALRASYRRHLIEGPNGGPYNPVLDDPNHPDNPKHWVHGDPQGYLVAGCTDCDPCSAAGREHNQKSTQKRVDKKLDSDRARIAATLTSTFLDLEPEDVQHGAELVIATHRVRNHYKALIDYDVVPVQLALSKWHTDARRHVDDEVLADIAAALVKVLQQ